MKTKLPTFLIIWLLVCCLYNFTGSALLAQTNSTSGVAGLQPAIDKPIKISDIENFQPIEPKRVVDETPPIVPVSIVTQFAVLAMLSLAPFIIMLLTSFIKIVIVLSLLRNAIGSQQTPPNQVINGVALMLTMYVMFPTGLAMYDACKDTLNRSPPKEILSNATASFVIEVVDKAKEPLRDFLMRYTERANIQNFYQMSYRVVPQEYRDKLQPDNFIVIIPAFVTSQIKNAFEVAVMVYLPFFVIDLVTSNILLAMGMQMLSPMTISLPLKLLLLVMVDGWTLITQGLVLSYR